MITEHLEQIAAITVVIVIKDSLVTLRRGRAQMDVTQDTKESTATSVNYQLYVFQLGLYCRNVNGITIAIFSWDLLQEG